MKSKMNAVWVAIMLFVATPIVTAQQWDYNHHIISVWQTGAFTKYKLEGQDYTQVGTPNHIMLRWDWIMPQDGMWAFGDGTGLAHIITTLVDKGNDNVIYGSIAELGYGWMFNNKRPIKIGDIAQIKLGMGFSFGLKGYTSTLNNNTVDMPSFPIEIASFTQIGSRLFVFPKVGFQPMYGNDGLRGGRVLLDMKSTFKLTNWFGVNLTLGTDKYNYNAEHKNPQNNTPDNPPADYAELGETFKIRYLQLGVVFISGPKEQKPSRDK